MDARGGDFSMKYFCLEFQGKAPGGGCTGGGKFFDEILLRRISREGSCVGDPVEK